MITPTPETAAVPHEGGAACPMDFILRMLMGPWTTYIVYNLQDLRAAALRRAEAPRRRRLGQDADRAAAHLEGAAWSSATTRRPSRPRSPIRSPRAATSSTTCWSKLADVAIRWQAEDRACNKKAELKAAS